MATMEMLVLLLVSLTVDHVGKFRPKLFMECSHLPTPTPTPTKWVCNPFASVLLSVSVSVSVNTPLLVADLGGMRDGTALSQICFLFSCIFRQKSYPIIG